MFFSIDFSRLVFICFQSFIYLSPLHLLRLFACNMKSQTQPRRIIAKSTKLIKNSQMNDNNLRRCFTCIANWIRKYQNYVSLRWFDAWICDSRIIFFLFFWSNSNAPMQCLTPTTEHKTISVSEIVDCWNRFVCFVKVVFFYCYFYVCLTISCDSIIPNGY